MPHRTRPSSCSSYALHTQPSRVASRRVAFASLKFHLSPCRAVNLLPDLEGIHQNNQCFRVIRIIYGNVGFKTPIIDDVIEALVDGVTWVTVDDVTGAPVDDDIGVPIDDDSEAPVDDVTGAPVDDDIEAPTYR